MASGRAPNESLRPQVGRFQVRPNETEGTRNRAYGTSSSVHVITADAAGGSEPARRLEATKRRRHKGFGCDWRGPVGRRPFANCRSPVVPSDQPPRRLTIFVCVSRALE